MSASRQFINRRSLVVGLNTRVPLRDGSYQVAINFDNAATTPPLKSVMLAVNEFAPWYASINRGAGYKSRYATRTYETAREQVIRLIGGDPYYHTVIFVKNATEAINKLAYRLSTQSDHQNIVICTAMEHHSNDLPWRDKFQVEYVEVDQQGYLRLDDLERKLRQHRGQVRLVTVSGASNVTGIVNPVHDIARLAHENGAEIMVDGAQLVPHRPVKMGSPDHPEGLDYLVFSAHKMYAPFGIGVLVGNRNTFQYGSSELVGGGTVDMVTPDMVVWAPPPERDEAGTPNVFGAVALTAAIKTLTEIGMDKLKEEETALAGYIRQKLSSIPNITRYGDNNNPDSMVGIISFNIQGLPHELVATILALEYGIAVRNGCFCAQPYVQKLLRISSPTSSSDNGMVRVSLGLYNTICEADTLIKALQTMAADVPEFIKKYTLTPHGTWQPN